MYNVLQHNLTRHLNFCCICEVTVLRPVNPEKEVKISKCEIRRAENASHTTVSCTVSRWCTSSNQHAGGTVMQENQDLSNTHLGMLQENCLLQMGEYILVHNTLLLLILKSGDGAESLDKQHV